MLKARYEFAVIGIGILGLLGINAVPARAALITLSDENSQVLIDTTSPDNLIGWVVEGVSQIDTQGFWYRVGPTAEESVQGTLTEVFSIPTDTDGDGELDQLVSEYQNPGLFNIAFRYALEGSNPGSNRSLIFEEIEIENISETPLDFNLFSVVDFNLNSSPDLDTLTVSRDPDTNLVTATETLPGTPTIATLNTNPQTDRYQVEEVSDLFNLLTDDVPSDLALTDGPANIADADTSFAFQFIRLIEPGQSVLFSQSLFVEDVVPPVVSVPEHSSPLSVIAISAIGGGLLLKHRQKK
ncbi:MAG: hypothetical protein AAGF26_13550 [Cyanobacteria bacterium P01_G01_bin.49]